MSADNWEAYWRNASSASAHKDGGPQDKALEKFWAELFVELLPGLQNHARMLDIACGNGAVAGFALASIEKSGGAKSMQICGVDESLSAVYEMCKRYPLVQGVAADSVELPFINGTFDLVSSQFGIEYGGEGAYEQAARLLRPGGILATVMHLHNGGIYKECEIVLQAIDDFRKSGLLGNFQRLYQLIIDRKPSAGHQQLIRDVDRDFAASVVAVEKIMQQWGKGIANETLFRIYSDIGHMYRRLQTYDADELFNWIAVMKAELDSYAGRMSSMLDAALKESDYKDVASRLQSLGFAIRVQDTMAFGQRSVASAWVLIAENRPS